MCVCVCVRARARARACVCVRVWDNKVEDFVSERQLCVYMHLHHQNKHLGR